MVMRAGSFKLYEKDGTVGVDLDISVGGESICLDISGWPAFGDKFPDSSIDTSAGYSLVSEDGGWTRSGLLYCGIVDRKLILKLEPKSLERLDFPDWGPISLDMSDGDISLLWQRLVEIFQYEEVSPPAMEFKSG